MKQSWILEAEKILGVTLNVGNRNNDVATDGPCPVCGGDDRLLVYRNTGLAYCTHSDCGFKTWLYGKPNNDSIKESLALISREKTIVSEKLRNIDWQEYYFNLLGSDRAIDLWKNRGFDLETCTMFGLGYSETGPDHTNLETLTIPVFFRQRLVDIRHRIVNPIKEKGGKYTSHYRKMIPYPYNGDGVLSKKPVFLVEGEIKAMHFLKHGINSIGFPGKNMGTYALSTLSPYFNPNQRWIVAFDPELDAEVEARIMAHRLLKYGIKDVRMCYFPLKPDDFLLKYGLDLSIEVINQSIKV